MVERCTKHFVAGAAVGAAALLSYNGFVSKCGPIPFRLLTTDGSVPVLMYHHINNEGGRYSVSPETFREHLKFLYEHDYKIINPHDYLSGKYAKQLQGKKPVLLTFDDASIDHFNIIDSKIEPNCAVGILEDFVAVHPDFGKGATFFVDYDSRVERDGPTIPSVPFEQSEDVVKKLKFLQKKGYVIGNHPYQHANIQHAAVEEVKKEVETLDAKLGRDTTLIAYPFGRVPEAKEVMNYLTENMNMGFAGNNDLAQFLGKEGYSQMVEGFNPMLIPRIEMNEYSGYKLRWIDFVVSRNLEQPETQEKEQGALKPKRPVILDPGHGGKESGTSILDITEDEFAYDITVRVRELLLKDGYEVHQTVFDSKTKYAPQNVLANTRSESLLYKNGKKSKLTKRYLTRRCALIDSVFRLDDEPLLVSIHINSTHADILGASFYYPGQEFYGSAEIEKKSLELAMALQEAFDENDVLTAALDYKGIAFDWLVPDLRGNVKRGKDFQLAIFEKTKVETKVLIEVANGKNERDKKRIQSSKERQIIAEAIYQGIVDYDSMH